MFSRLKFHHKLFFSFSIFIFIILVISGIIFYSAITTLLEKNIANNQMQTTQKIQEQLDSLLREMDGITIQINSSELIMDILKNIPREEENYFDKYPRIRDRIRNTLFSLTAQKPLRGRISVISRQLDYVDLSNRLDSRNVTKEYLGKILEIGEMMASDAYKVFLAPHIEEWSSNGELVFSAVRPLRDNYSVYGLVEVNYTLAELDRICSFEDETLSIHAALYDRNDHLIYDNFDRNIKRDKRFLYNKQIAHKASGNYRVKNELGKTFIASFVKLNNVQWTLVLFEDFDVFMKPVNYLRYIIGVSYLMVFIIILLTLYLFSGSITKPIRHLKEALSQADIDRLKLILADDHTNDEITLLGNAFQDLLDETKTAMHKMMEFRSREMQAHFTALQSQLNPHFLYNTLTVIGAYGQKEGNTEVSKMCSILSDLLRYTVNTDEKYATLTSEFRHVENYLQLMSRRLENFLEFHIHSNPLLNQVLVPRLVLQPLVENAFQHAFNDREPPWMIDINGYLEDGRWIIAVKDNGSGFAPDVLTAIHAKLDNFKQKLADDQYVHDSPEGGLGLMNTFIRFIIFYQGKECIDFYNNPDGGATIIIGGPLKQE